jgi:hypothetical protein
MPIKIEQLKDIATWMRAEKPSELPAILQGIFFMDGNRLPDDCLTLYDSKWNADKLTLSLPVYAPMKWTFHASKAGRRLLLFVKFVRLTYVIRFEDETLQRAHIMPVLLGLPIPSWLLDFLMYRDEGSPDENTWHRKNALFCQILPGGYTLRRIVDNNSKPTPAFQEMLSKVNDDCLVIVKD